MADGGRLFGAALLVAAAGAASAATYLETRSSDEREDLARRAREIKAVTGSWIQRQAKAAMDMVEPARAAAESALLSEVILAGQVAAAWRAVEHQSDDALLNDPWAEQLAGKWAMRKVRSGLSSPYGTAVRKEGDLILIRTRYFDDFLLGAVAEHVSDTLPTAVDGEPSAPPTPERYPPTRTHQVVLVASACDSRPYRCELPRGTVVFDLDSEAAMARKAEVMSKARARPAKGVSAVRVPCELDLHVAGDRRRPTWVSKLLSAGFDPHSPSVWLLEGALAQASEAQVHYFMKRATDLSAPGSKWCCSIPVRSTLRSNSPNSDAGSISGLLPRCEEGSVARAGSHVVSRRTVPHKKTTGAWSGDLPEALAHRFGMICVESVRAGSEKANYGRWPGQREGSSLYVTFQKFDPQSTTRNTTRNTSGLLDSRKLEVVQRFLSESVTPEAPLSEVTDDAQSNIPNSEVFGRGANQQNNTPREVDDVPSSTRGNDVMVGPVSGVQSQSSDQDSDEEASLNIELIINEDVLRGASIRICGNRRELGSWDPMEAPIITPNTKTGTDLKLYGPGALEYKFVILDSEEVIRWEKGANRHLNARPGATHVRHVWRVV